MNRIVLLLAITILQVAVAAEHRDWKTAILYETHRAMDHEGNIEYSVQVYTLDLGDRAIVCAERFIGRRFKPMEVVVGADVRYSRSGSSLYILDAKGKEHKLQIQQETMKPVDRSK